MRILFITSTFPRFENEVLAKWIGELTIRLKNKGITVDVLAPSSRGRPSRAYFGIRVNRFRYSPRSWEVLTQDEGAVVKIRQNPLFAALVPLYILFGIIATIRQLQKEHYDIIHVHWPFPNGIFGLVAKYIASVPLVFTFYGAEFALMGHVPGGKWILGKILEKADMVSAISSYTAEQVQQVRQSVAVRIIPFGVSSIFDRHKITRVSYHLQNRSKQILCIGRLIERKGIKYLIAAMPTISNMLDARLIIVGDGPHRNSLENLVTSLGLRSAIRFAGKVPDKELNRLYRQSDVIVLPAIHDSWGETEGLGVVLLEAMVQAKPVVATRVGGIIDIVKHNKTGLLVEEKDSVGLAIAILEILTNPKRARQLGRAGDRFVRKYFGWDHIVSETIMMYKDSLWKAE